MATQTNQAINTKTGINSTYDTNLAAQKQALTDAYNANTAAQAEAGQNIQKNAGTAAYDVGVQNARNDRNITQFADLRGVNTGAGSQHRLNLGHTQNAAMNTINVQQQGALAENLRQQELAKTDYQNMMTQALADNDYKRAAALLDDYKNQQQWQEQQAEILASYGNFDAYGNLYGQDAATQARNVWLAQNPDVAYRTGQISADQYRNITGEWPRGYTPPSSGGIDWSSYRAPKTEEEPIILRQSWQTQTKSKGPSSHASSSHSSTPKATGGTTVNKSGFSGGSGKF